MSATLPHHRRIECEDECDEQIQGILNEVRAQRAAGRQVHDEEIVARHPDLSPKLSDALALLKKIQMSFRPIAAMRIETGGEDDADDFRPESSRFDSTIRRIMGYRLLRPIERGGQGTVFLAIQESTQRKVAIKVLDGGAFVTPHKQDRFEREVKALVVLDHPGIVRIVDRGRTADGSFFIAMDYVDGEDLDVYLGRKRAEGWNARDVTELFVKIAGALGEAHRLGIIHRDIKPSNIRIDGRDEPRILDFGLARLTAAADDDNPNLTVTVTGGVVGSLPWASPEQASGDSAKLCAASDVYSLGVVFYRALVGHSPYDLTGTLRQRMHNICEVMPMFPTRADSPLPFGGVDPVLADVILKSLEKDPARRYSDAANLATELEEYLAGRLQKFPRRAKRRRFVPAVVMSVLILGIAAAWTMSSHHNRTTTVLAARLPTIKNSVGMKLILIPAGTFLEGTPNSESDYNPDEQLHQVTLTHPYYIGRTEVTRSEYRRVMGSLPSEIVPFHGDDQLPVDYVSRAQADEFCRRLSHDEIRHYRLPTEAEWENACRAGTTTAFSGTGQVGDIAWYAGNSDGRLQAVGLKQPNNWGLYDMEGNVNEWCADQFIDRLGNSSTVNPIAIPHGQSLGVVRGGSYQYSSLFCRATARVQFDPDKHTAGVGFRIAMDIATSGDSANRK